MTLQENQYYNAYEKDIAVVNIFFGGSTVFGELLYVQYNTPNKLIVLIILLIQNLRGLKR